MDSDHPTAVEGLLDRGRAPESLDQQRALAEVVHRMFDGQDSVPTFARYVILGDLGAGGEGVVFKAHDPELNREVAIKLIQATPSHPDREREGRRRLRREAQAMAKVSHPNVISVFDVGTYDERDLGMTSLASSDLEVPLQGVFVVMELVQIGRAHV